MTGQLLDDRLPPLCEITEPTRQIHRQIVRKADSAHPVLCAKCRRPLDGTEDICLADGLDAHRECAETWNSAMAEAFEELQTQDAAQGGQD